MQIGELPRRLGLEGGRGDVRLAWTLLAAALLAYVLAFAVHYPRIPINDDESMYLRQTHLLLEGKARTAKIDPLTGAEIEVPPSTYPLGTALLLAPAVWAGGWRGAYVAPLLALLASVLLAARWLSEQGYSPVFALVIFGFPPTLVFGRVAMSEAPSLLVVTLGLWLFWRGLDRGAGWWLASGFVAGASLIFRESNPLPFVPLYAGTLVRREGKAWALIVGGLAGLSLRVLTNTLAFGDPFYARDTYPFSPGTIGERLPLYLLGLLVFVPGGLGFGLAYRGRRWPEVVSAIGLFFAFYLLQAYSTIASGPSKRLILALRYFVPLLPLLALATAEAAPRLWTALRARRAPRGREVLQRLAGLTLAAWLAAVLVAGVAVHGVMDRWIASQALLREAILSRVGRESVVVTNLYATNKFIEYLDRRFRPLDRGDVSPDQIRALADRHGEVLLVLLDRTDSALWRLDAQENAAFLSRLSPPPDLRLDLQATATDRLRIWRIGGRAPES